MPFEIYIKRQQETKIVVPNIQTLMHFSLPSQIIPLWDFFLLLFSVVRTPFLLCL